MQATEGLSYLGLNEKQAKIYMALLQFGQSTAYAVAEATNLKRPTVYVVLEDLRMKGLVRKIPHAKKQLFSAKAPDEFLAETQDKLDRAKAVLPQLLALTKSEQRPKTYLFEGIKGVEEALAMHLNSMAGKELIGFYAQAAGIPKELFAIFEKYNQKMKNLNIKSRGIVPDHPSLKIYRKRDQEFGREMKIVPFSVFSSNNVVEIGQGFVKIISFHDLHAVIIENRGIAQTFKQIFEMVWKSTLFN
ncbi:MAG: TrmB family transcriptional regulator [Candidatus Doudnabacteria bacterium]|nr:TrmB family transcriptional regulator [Candidatus Doudnabacteria bacterium]